MTTGFPPIRNLITHSGSMRLIDHVLAFDDQSVKVSAHVDPHAWYADATGAMPGWIGIELMAQAIAAWAGLQGWRTSQPPKKGFLLGTRNYICRLPAFPAHSQLEISANEAFREANGLGAFDCLLRLGGEVVAEASLKVFEPVDFEAFMEQQP